MDRPRFKEDKALLKHIYNLDLFYIYYKNKIIENLCDKKYWKTAKNRTCINPNTVYNLINLDRLVLMWFLSVLYG